MLMRFTDGVIALPLLPLLIVLGALDLTKLGFFGRVRAFRGGRLLARRGHRGAGRLDRRSRG